MTCSESGPTPSSSVAARTSASTVAASGSDSCPRTMILPGPGRAAGAPPPDPGGPGTSLDGVGTDDLPPRVWAGRPRPAPAGPARPTVTAGRGPLRDAG